MKLLHAPRVKPEIGSPRRIKLAQAMGVKVVINISGAKVVQVAKRFGVKTELVVDPIMMQLA
jgi:hypothetical protein